MFAHSFKISDLCKIIDKLKCKGINSVLNFSSTYRIYVSSMKEIPWYGEKIQITMITNQQRFIICKN